MSDSRVPTKLRRVVAIQTAIALGVSLVAILPTNSTRAGEMSVPCDEPTVWPGAAVNAVVLPYRYTGRDNKPLSEAARQLTLLTHMNVLFSMLKYGGVGATALTTSGVDEERVLSECTPETVMANVLGQRSGAGSQVAPKSGVLLLWGFLYEEGDDVFVQSYARFARRGVPDRLTLNTETGDGGSVALSAHFPEQAFAFAPRRLSTETLKAIGAAFLATAKVHSDPNGASMTREIVVDPDVPFSFYVTDAREGWMEIRSYGGGIGGWIKAEPYVGEKTLAQEMPEIHFVEALAAYMRYQIALDGTREYGNPGALVDWAREAVERYEHSAGENRAAAPAAAARILLGNLAILSADSEKVAAAVRSASLEYSTAASLVPSSAAARNFDAMARVYLGKHSGWSNEPAGEIAGDLQDALALNPTDPDVLANLEGLFEMMVEAAPESDKARLQRKVAAVKRARESLDR